MGIDSQVNAPKDANLPLAFCRLQSGKIASTPMNPGQQVANLPDARVRIKG